MSTIDTVYISGPMSGYANFNYEAFSEAADIMREAGYLVHNPAEFYDGDQSLSWHEYMRRDITMILNDTDAVVALQGWEGSQGATVEISLARALGLPVWDITNWGDVENNLIDPNAQVPDHPNVTGQEEVKVEPRVIHYVGYTGNTTANSYSYSYQSYPQQRQPAKEVPTPAVETILEEAAKAVDGPREQVYNHPLDNFTLIAKYWSLILDCPVTPEQHAMCMIAVKMARLTHSPDHRDTQVDIAGYARTIEKLQTERKRRNGLKDPYEREHEILQNILGEIDTDNA